VSCVWLGGQPDCDEAARYCDDRDLPLNQVRSSSDKHNTRHAVAGGRRRGARRRRSSGKRSYITLGLPKG